MFDSADVYSDGLAEEVLGKAIAGRRDKVIVSTKATFRSGPGPNDVGSSRYHLLQACEASLRRLGTDYIDLYQLHGFDALTPIEETLSTLDGLVRSGKVRYIGCSNFSGWHLMKSLAISDRYGLARHVAHQAYYSLVGRDYEWELMPLGLDQRVGTVVWSPLGWGRLIGKIRRNQPPPATSRLPATADYGPPVDDEYLYRVVDAIDAATRHCATADTSLCSASVVSLSVRSRVTCAASSCYDSATTRAFGTGHFRCAESAKRILQHSDTLCNKNALNCKHLLHCSVPNCRSRGAHIRSSLMLAEERQNLILSLVNQRGSVSVTEMQRKLKVSRETIRRDIVLLAQRQRLRKAHGGALSMEAVEPAMAVRQLANAEGKRAIARIAAELVPDGAAVILGGGTTVQCVADALTARQSLTLFSNDIASCSKLAGRNGNRVFVLGGELNNSNGAILGRDTTAMLAHYFADFAFIGAGAITANPWLMDYTREESELNKLMLSSARTTVVVADHTKFNRFAPVRVDNFEKVTYLVTDRRPDERMLSALGSLPLDLRVAAEEAD